MLAIDKIFDRLKLWGLKQSFQPNFLSIFLNPFFFIRRGLYRGIRKHAPVMEGVLLDFGCGRKPYRNLFNVKEYIGVDIEQSGHPHELSRIDVYYDGKSIPFPDDFFNCALCSEVIEHVFEIDAILQELNRVLMKNGRILITVPFVWNDHEVPYDYGRYSTYGIKYLLEKHGFKILEMDKSTNFVETIFQLWMLYIHEILKTKSSYFNSLTNILFISPFAVLGLMVSKILPNRSDLYHNTIIMAVKN